MTNPIIIILNPHELRGKNKWDTKFLFPLPSFDCQGFSEPARSSTSSPWEGFYWRARAQAGLWIEILRCGHVVGWHLICFTHHVRNPIWYIDLYDIMLVCFLMLKSMSPWNPTCLQVSAGTDIITKTVQAFCNPSSKATAIIDLHAYDGFSALAALQAIGPVNVLDPVFLGYFNLFCTYSYLGIYGSLR